MSTKVFIDGEHGTTGLQIRTRLAGRGDLEILSIPEADRRNRDIRADHLRSADIVILCLPDEAARESVSLLEGSGATRIIDTSTAHRTADGWAYGFAEMTAGQDARIAAARLVANPGCYPTGAIALVRPLVEAGLMARDHNVTVNAVSGYTGGGKQLIAQMEDRSHPDAIAAPHFLYGLSLQHKHVPEMRVHGLLTHPPVFSPSVGRFPQGMIVQVPLHTGSLARSVDPADLHAALAAHYQGTAVEVVPLEESAGLARIDAEELAGSDRLRLFVFGAKGKGQANLVALLDNLGKGASGAAVQNMDSMIAGGR